VPRKSIGLDHTLDIEPEFDDREVQFVSADEPTVVPMGSGGVAR
jgi:hypothetical protein